MKIKPDKISISKTLDLQENWIKNAILKMFDLDDFEEHPRVKMCNEYLSDINLLSPKARKK